ncbi:unnamed protein product [Auanema sp. JU1783]|nr:unnamed protein product [Auanema sp. JU1783]
MLAKVILFVIALENGFSKRILDSPIIIERPSSSHIEWNDLILEYNPDSSPSANLSISVSIAIISSKYDQTDNILKVIFDLNQKWIDYRLVFHGDEMIPVPDNIHIWLPDTIIHNSVADVIRKKSIFLSPGGSVELLERRNADVICKNETKCDLMIRSFANRGAHRLLYEFENPNNSTDDMFDIEVHKESFTIITRTIPYNSTKYLFNFNREEQTL